MTNTMHWYSQLIYKATIAIGDVQDEVCRKSIKLKKSDVIIIIVCLTDSGHNLIASDANKALISVVF